ncbi:hypothetical protein ABPG74_002708 [Tetrahymena malaccensis]
MKFLPFVFLALLAFCSAQNVDLKQVQELIQCLQNKQDQYQVCQQNDVICRTEAISMKECVEQCEYVQTYGQLKSCIQSKCKPIHPVNQNNLKLSLSCLSSTLLQFSLVLTFILISIGL